MYYVYILKRNDERFYIGCTNDLRDRIERHSKGYISATKDKRPIKLYCYFAFENRYTAFNFEKYLKSGSGRVFMKKHLINS